MFNKEERVRVKIAKSLIEEYEFCSVGLIAQVLGVEQIKCPHRPDEISDEEMRELEQICNGK